MHGKLHIKSAATQCCSYIITLCIVSLSDRMPPFASHMAARGPGPSSTSLRPYASDVLMVDPQFLSGSPRLLARRSDKLVLPERYLISTTHRSWLLARRTGPYRSKFRTSAAVHPRTWERTSGAAE
ncbi:hypothetical protein K466DRAFT_10460 [Polyporus arcularius HHB13444]|uniref:Uncharacterized protein n=1 Tax=Polyporus arcularius HHB13444 TaxID=1314778 RepID=A0A5C3NUE5_9APHY|nr:hypothetical protein K466DRAFT_10460 [Polyporus arcularius HHB13444]